jgi:hypothetical protein
MFEFITLAVVCLLLFVTWAFFKFVDLPVAVVTSTIINAGNSTSTISITADALSTVNQFK